MSQQQPAELLQAARLLSMGEPFLAERTATAGLKRYPDHGRLLQVRGIARHYLLHLGPAIADLEAAMALVPLDPLGIWCLADAYENQHRHDPARQLARWLISRKDCPTRLFPRIARMLNRLGEDEIALQAWEHCHKREPDNASALFEMGYLMCRLGYSPRAVLPRLKRAMELEPSDVSYRVQYALVELAAGEADQGKQILMDLPPSKVACPHLATRVAQALESLNRIDQATQWWRRSIDLARDPGYVIES
jgi:tetratricopeptide (TPR) repeat protein